MKVVHSTFCFGCRQHEYHCVKVTNAFLERNGMEQETAQSESRSFHSQSVTEQTIIITTSPNSGIEKTLSPVQGAEASLTPSPRCLGKEPGKSSPLGTFAGSQRDFADSTQNIQRIYSSSPGIGRQSHGRRRLRTAVEKQQRKPNDHLLSCSSLIPAK